MYIRSKSENYNKKYPSGEINEVKFHNFTVRKNLWNMELLHEVSDSKYGKERRDQKSAKEYKFEEMLKQWWRTYSTSIVFEMNLDG